MTTSAPLLTIPTNECTHVLTLAHSHRFQNVEVDPPSENTDDEAQSEELRDQEHNGLGVGDEADDELLTTPVGRSLGDEELSISSCEVCRAISSISLCVLSLLTASALITMAVIGTCQTDAKGRQRHRAE